MAGGAVVLQGLSFAPVMAISGIMLNIQGKKSLEAAKDIQVESQKAISSMNEAIGKLKALKDIGGKVEAELRILQQIYNKRLCEATLLVNRCQDYKQYTREEREQLHQLLLIVKLLKEITTQNLIEDDEIKKEAVIECINHSEAERRKMLYLQ